VNLAPVLGLLRQRIGLDPDALGKGAVAGAVGERMRDLGLADPSAYAALLVERAAEFDALVSDVVVPETWFFRGGGLFAWLAGHVGALVRERPAGPRVRLLSVPCSTGEEPYSLALALFEAGVVSGWTLDGVDLSRRHLERARRGRFGPFSFRQADAARSRWFRPAGDAWDIDPAVRDAVRFRAGNLVDPLLLSGEPPFDVVLCRNLLIYLHPAARVQALANLDRLLAPGGLLALGPAESPDQGSVRFERFGPVGLFLYRRAAAPPPTEDRGQRTEDRGQRTEDRGRPAPPAQEPAPAADPLARARQSADAGRLDEALARCGELLAAGPSAEVYSLMGVVHQARQERPEAARCFERALYLQPDHAEALEHLMLLYQLQGDGPRAALLRRRLLRCGAGGNA
jgi:chemotaxis protein methyltransferase WspC